MNDIEKEIAGIDEKEEIKIDKKINNYDNKNKKIIIIVTSIILLVAVLGVTIYLIWGRKDKNLEEKPKDNVVDKVDNNDKTDNTKKIAYVSCDDNTSLLNVRNSTSGDIIDGLSCFKEVTIEEEMEPTDNCSNWYKISYKKRGSNYTGYACGTYIKTKEVSSLTINKVKELVDKANDYYENNVLKAYCGKTNGKKTLEFTEGETTMSGEYLKSEYKTLDELKKYLLTFLDESLIKPKLELSDLDNKKYYDNYYEIDGELYCRNYAGKGWLTYYTNNYDIEITSESESRITANIAYEYLNENSKCTLDNLSSCPNSNFKYEMGKITIEKENDNFIITKIDFHK